MNKPPAYAAWHNKLNHHVFQGVFLSVVVLLFGTLMLGSVFGYKFKIPHLSSRAASEQTYDVVVVGGGSGGISAAIQAARLGSRVALLEETDQLGGQLLSVTSMDEGSLLPRESGIYKQFVQKITAYYQSQSPPKSLGTCYWNPGNMCFEPKAARFAINQMIQEVRSQGKVLDVYYGKQVTAALKHPTSPNRVTGVATQSGDTYSAKVVIDATEYGDFIPLTGAAYRIGNGLNTANGCIQDITYTIPIKKYAPGTMPSGFRMTVPPPGYDQAKGDFAKIIAKNGSASIGQTPPYNFVTHNAYRGTPDSEGGQNYTASQTEAAKITKTFINWANDYPGFAIPKPDQPTLSAQYLSDRTFRAQANFEAKLKTIQFLYYIQTELAEPDWSVDNTTGFDTPGNIAAAAAMPLPGELQIFNKYFPPYPYVRESRRIVGMQTLTGGQIFRGGNPQIARTAFPTSIAVGYYPADLHNCAKNENLESSLESIADLPPNFAAGAFQVPFESMVPEAIDGFLAAEKNISQSRLANGATRLQPITMLTGQAAGAIAALAAQNNVQPWKLKPLQVQRVLLSAGNNLLMVPFTDVPRDNAFWPATQLTALYRTMIGYGNGIFGINDQMKRWTAAVVLANSFKLPLDPAPTVATFTDVPVSDPYFKQIEAIAKAGITSGCSASPKKFCPDALLPRSQFAVMLVSAMKTDLNSAPATPFFTDVPPEHWAFRYVQIMRQRGITSGCSATTFCPDTILTRGQAAAFLIGEMQQR